jgi:hypothetical protein
MQSPSEQFGDFLVQLPLAPFLTVCIAALLLMVAVAWIGYFKPRRRKAREEEAKSSPASDGSASDVINAELPPMMTEPEDAMPANDYRDDDDDFDAEPDLDALLDTSSLVKDLPESAPPEPRPTPEPTPAPPPPAPVVNQAVTPRPASSTVKLHTGEQVERNEIVAILRDPRDGRLIVQINGVGYRTLVDSPEVKARFVKIMRELSAVVTEPDTPPPADVPDTPVEPAPEAPSKPVSGAPPPPPIDEGGTMPGDLPKYKIEDSVTPQQGGFFSGRPKYEAQPIPELNIAASIEAYLQHKLRHTPEYSGRQIHVHSAPGGGVRIQVDQTFYEAVGDVADAEVRHFLSETIQEWQDRQ